MHAGYAAEVFDDLCLPRIDTPSSMQDEGLCARLGQTGQSPPRMHRQSVTCCEVLADTLHLRQKLIFTFAILHSIYPIRLLHHCPWCYLAVKATDTTTVGCRSFLAPYSCNIPCFLMQSPLHIGWLQLLA